MAKRPTWWDDLRGAATLYMVATGIVYNTLLLDVDVGNLATWVNNVTHRIIPLVMLADWLIAPPRDRIGRRTTLLWLAFPILYCVYSLIRGLFVDFYPYPFRSSTGRRVRPGSHLRRRPRRGIRTSGVAGRVGRQPAACPRSRSCDHESALRLVTAP